MDKNFTLSFEEVILNGKRGERFVGERFSQGACIEIQDKYGAIKLLTYRSSDDIFGNRQDLNVSKSLFTQKYSIVFTRQSLFK